MSHIYSVSTIYMWIASYKLLIYQYNLWILFAQGSASPRGYRIGFGHLLNT